jgi:rhomboid protease GluP
LPTCRQCGAELPSFTFGEASPFCKTCRSQLPAEPRPPSAGSLALPAGISVASQATPATYLLLAINIGIFIVMIARGVPLINPTAADVLPWGANYGPQTLGGQYWRLFTSMFLHFGIIHIFGNMWCLWSLGRLAEKLLDSITVVGLYLLTGIGAALLSLSWDPMRVGAGASGAIFGIAGALITVLHFGKLGLPTQAVKKLLGYVVRFAILNLLFGVQGHIDNMAHFGGLVTGLLMGFFIARTLNTDAEERAPRRRVIMAFSAAIILALTVSVIHAKQFAVELGKGMEYLEKNDPASAIPHLQNYLASHPEDAKGHFLLASAFQRANHFDEAAGEYERGLQIVPNDPYMQVNLARIYAFQKKTSKALPLFSKAMPNVQPDAGSFYWYADALKDSGNLAEAESNSRRAVQLDPKGIDAHKLLAEILTLERKKSEAVAENMEIEKLAVEDDRSSR